MQKSTTIRYRGKIPTWSPSGSFFVVIIVICGMTLLINKFTFTSTDYYKIIEQTTALPNIYSLPSKRVTKSLAELGPMDELNPHVLFLNSVPQCGSEVLVFLLQRLQGWNNFRHVRLKGSGAPKLNRQEQEDLVYEVTEVIKSRAVPLTFDRHIYFTNFTEYGRQSPTFINIIRDPIDKFIARSYATTPNINLTSSLEAPGCLNQSSSNCISKNQVLNGLSVPYFCGHHNGCELLNNEWALNIAKSNVERYFVAVGVLEELTAYLKVLEYKLPNFFRGALNVYKKELLKHRLSKNMKKNPRISKSKYKYLRKKFTMEYDFYHWIRKRLMNQLQEVKRVPTALKTNSS